MDQSADSKLAEFRRRLASGRLVDASAMTTDRSQSVLDLERHMLHAAVDIDKVGDITLSHTLSYLVIVCGCQ